MPTDRGDGEGPWHSGTPPSDTVPERDGIKREGTGTTVDSEHPGSPRTTLTGILVFKNLSPSSFSSTPGPYFGSVADEGGVGTG